MTRLADRLRAVVRAGSSWRRLGPEDRPAFLAAWWALLTSRLRLGLPFLCALGGPVAHGRVSLPKPREGVELGRLLAVFRLAGRTHLFNPTCLPRSLALHRFLAQHGVATDLRLGIRRGAQGLEGHAWVERQGVPFDDTKRLQSYVPLEWTR